MADLKNIEYAGTTFTIPVGGGSGAQNLRELQDVALSTSPPAGALFGFDGTDWTDVASVLNTALTGLDKTQTGVIVATDTLIAALGKLQNQLTTLQDRIDAYSDTSLTMTDGTATVEKLVLSKNKPVTP